MGTYWPQTATLKVLFIPFELEAGFGRPDRPAYGPHPKRRARTGRARGLDTQDMVTP